MRSSEFRTSNEVLLTADNGDALQLYRTGLEHDGFTVFPTASPANAAAFVERGRPPNALVVVASLREQQAWSRIEPLLASAAAARIPVVLVTATVRADGQNRRAALRRGCAAFLGQPCLPDQLSRVVRRVIAGELRIVSPPLPG